MSRASTAANVTRYRESVAKPRTAKGRARLTVERLAEIYPGTAAELCALDFKDPFQLLAATILSAQSTDARVNMVTPALFAAYPDAASLAAANPEHVEELVRSTGFFRAKTRSLIGMASAVADRYGGEVPTDLKELVTIPGVGRKTGNVERSVAFGLPGLPVDTHVLRVSERLGPHRGPATGCPQGRGEGRAGAERLHSGGRAGRIQPPDDSARTEHVCCPETPLQRMSFG